MAVKVGSARSDENGKITGGKAGDQTGNEVSTQNWYLHSKGWRVFRVTSADAAEKIAKCMQSACDNNNIGYDQNERNSLYNAAKPLGFDTSKVTTKVETDCSALVRVCCAYAGISLSDFNTSSEANTLLASGKFVELTDTKYTKQSDYLRRGDILVTKTKGHTVVVLSNGSKAGSTPPTTTTTTTYKLGDRLLKKGSVGSDVKELQSNLIKLGYSCGKCGADGDFGSDTDTAVRAFQKASKIDVDGEYGANSHKAMVAAMAKLNTTSAPTSSSQKVRITGGQCWVRSEPNTSGKQLGIAAANTTWEYTGQKSADGWLQIRYNNQTGWVSGKYGKLI